MVFIFRIVTILFGVMAPMPTYFRVPILERTTPREYRQSSSPFGVPAKW